MEGVFVPLNDREAAAVRALLRRRGFPGLNGQILKQFLIQEATERPSKGSAIVRAVGDWITEHPDELRTIGQVARSMLRGQK